MTIPPARSRARRAAGVGAAALALAAAGCGASGGKSNDAVVRTTTTRKAPQDPVKALQGAVDPTLAATSFTLDSDVKLEFGPQLLRLTAQGSIDYDTLVGDVRINLDSTAGSNELDIRTNGKLFWLRPEGDQAPTIPDGKTWLRGDADLLTSSTSLKPSGLIGVVIALRGTETAKRVGTGTADGVDTTTYETTIAYDGALAAAGKDRAAFKSALSLQASEAPDLKIKVSVGSDGIIRTFDLEVQAAPKVPLDGSYRVELSNVNKKVEKPKAPPAGDTLTGPKAERILKQLIK